MGNPITWQSIIGPSAAESAARITDSASNSFNRAAAVTQDAFAKAEANASQQLAFQKDQNTQDYLNKVAEIGKTPEQLQAALADGSLEKLRQGYGNVIDHTATRSAGENLLNQRYQQADTAMKYTHMVKNDAGKPFADAYRVATLKGDTAGANALYDKFVATGAEGGGALAVEANNITEQLKGNIRSQGKYEADLKHLVNQDAAAASNAKASMISAGAAASNAATNARMTNANIQEMGYRRSERLDAIEVAKQSAQAAAKLNKLQADGNLYGKGIYTGSDAPALMDSMTKMGIGGTGDAGVERRNEVLKVLGDGFVEIQGKQVPIPKSVAEQVVLMAGNPFFTAGWNSGTANVVKDQLQKLMGGLNTDNKSFKHTTDLEAYQNATGNIVQHPLMGANKPKSSAPNYPTGKVR